MSGRMIPSLAASLVACAPHGNWADVREACGLSEIPDNLHAALDADDPVGRDLSISESCASALARSHGASLRSLELEERPIEKPEAIGEVVVTALFDLAAADFGRTEDLVAIEGLADSIVESLTAWDEPDASTALFLYSENATKEISLTDADEAGISTADGHVVVAAEFADMLPVRMATDFAHEAAHHFDVPSHVECFEDETGYPYCDRDSRGANGFEAAVEYEWVLALAADETIDGSECRDLCKWLDPSKACDLILDPGSFVPCENAATACLDHCPP